MVFLFVFVLSWDVSLCTSNGLWNAFFGPTFYKMCLIIYQNMFDLWRWQVYPLQWAVAVDHIHKGKECNPVYPSSWSKFLLFFIFVIFSFFLFPFSFSISSGKFGCGCLVATECIHDSHYGFDVLANKKLWSDIISLDILFYFLKLNIACLRIFLILNAWMNWRQKAMKLVPDIGMGDFSIPRLMDPIYAFLEKWAIHVVGQLVFWLFCCKICFFADSYPWVSIMYL